MDGCSGFPPDPQTASISNIQLIAEKKTAATPKKGCRSRFPTTKITESVLAQIPVFFHI